VVEGRGDMGWQILLIVFIYLLLMVR